MFNRIGRDKLPMIVEVSSLDEEIRDLDKINKHKGKEQVDNSRNAKESNIDVGDKVLIKNFNKDNKLAPNFLPEEYIVIKRMGGDILLENAEKRTCRRNVAHLKLLEKADNSESFTMPIVDSDNFSNFDQMHSENGVETLETSERRLRRTSKLPSTLKDFVL